MNLSVILFCSLLNQNLKLEKIFDLKKEIQLAFLNKKLQRRPIILILDNMFS